MSSVAVLTIVPKSSEMPSSPEAEIHRFLTDETNGHALFEALYGVIEDRAIPQSMTRLLTAWRERRAEFGALIDDNTVAVLPVAL